MAAKLAAKVANLRVFDDDAGVMNRSLLDVGRRRLVVSQFTLYGDTARGRRPSWVAAARPEQAEPLVEAFTRELAALGRARRDRAVPAEMQVALVNDGPVTLLLEADLTNSRRVIRPGTMARRHGAVALRSSISRD